LTRLATLSLDRTPAMDVIQATALTWHDAIRQGKDWQQERDRPRFQAAFRTLVQACTQWPSPRQFLDALPAIPRPEEVQRIEHEERRVRGLEHLREIGKSMGWSSDEEGGNATATAP